MRLPKNRLARFALYVVSVGIIAVAVDLLLIRVYARVHPGPDTTVLASPTLPDGRVVDSHVVARLDDSCPDWTERFLLAKELAEERAFHLNSGEEPPP